MKPTAAPTPAAATQAAPASGAPATAPEPALNSEDIIIYARRRAETVFNAPVAVTALNSGTLAQQSVSQIADLTRVAPNVVVRQSSSGAGDIQVMIRGQVIAISNPSVDSPVAIYFDDAYIAEGKGLTGSAFDLDSVEIARGVQGTLSGRNATGGAIRFYTAKPVLDKTSIDLSGSLGEHDLHRESAVLNFPIGETLAVRLGMQDSYRGPLGHDVITGEGVQGINQQLYRASLKWQPSPSFSTVITYDHTRINQRPMAFHSPLGGVITNAVIACTRNAVNVSGACYPASVVSPPNIHDVATTDPIGHDHVNANFVRGTADYSISDALDAKLTLAYRDLAAITQDFDVDYGPALSTLATEFGALSKTFTAEPQLTAKLFDNKLTLIGGYFYFRDNAVQPSTVRAGLSLGPSYGFFTLKIRDKLVNTSNAGYVHGEFKATPAWTIAGGVRYTHDDRVVNPNNYVNNADPRSFNYQNFLAGKVPAQVCRITHVVNGVATPLNATGPCPASEAKAAFSYWSYEASTRYEFNDRLSAYARTGRGQKSGGLTSPLTSLSDAPFKPEEVTDYELGLKASRLLDNMLSFNVALYYSDYKNMQRYTSSLQIGGAVASEVFNVGSAHIKGIEVDFSAHPTQGLTLSGFLGYTDAKYKKFTVNTAAGSFDLSQNPFYQTPKVTSRLGFQYEVPVNAGKLTFGGGWNYQSKASYYIFEFPQFDQKAYSLFDARITYAPSARWDVSLWATNLTNKQYFQGATVSPVSGFDASKGFNSGAVIPGDSREVALTVSLHF